MPCTLFVDSDRHHLVEVVQRFECRVFATQNVSFDEEGQRFIELIARMFADGHAEDIVEFLQRALLGLGDKEENHDERSDVAAWGV